MLRAEIRDAAGKIVAHESRPVTLAQGWQDVAARLELAEPHRWDGRADPYLYSVAVTLLDGGLALDSVTQPLGLRTFRFDADAGFFLNGEHLKLHGVSRHQDRMGKGWALSPEDHAEDMALVKELGANTIRQAHYQHADEWSDEADKAGIVVWAEVPHVAAPSLTGGKGSAELWANAEQQLREHIRQNYNHPSIAMWSIGNEVNSAHGFGVSSEPPKPLALLKRLNEVAKEEDPLRATTFADCCEELSMMETGGEKLTGTADLVGYNRYFGWYMPQPLDARKQFGEHLDMLHSRHPDVPMSISEYGAGAGRSQHSDDPLSGFVNFIGRPQPQEYQAWVHEQTWPVIAARDYIFASWVWNMFDFVSDLREEGDSVDLNTKGLVTFDRKEKKDAFYYYMAAWNDKPVLTLAGKGYRERAYPVMDVKAYTNAARASLTVNGQKIGVAECPNYTCVWKRVALEPGENEAVVEAGTLTDRTAWIGPDPAQGIRIDAGNLATSVIGGHRFGSDTFVSGGRPMVLNLAGFGGRRMFPQRDVEAAEPALYEYWRQGDAFAYEIPVPDGDWTVLLHLFEPDPKASPDQAVTVTANGSPVVDGLNVRQAAGGSLKAVARRFPVNVTGGILKLGFASSGGNVSLAAIEIVK